MRYKRVLAREGDVAVRARVSLEHQCRNLLLDRRGDGDRDEEAVRSEAALQMSADLSPRNQDPHSNQIVDPSKGVDFMPRRVMPDLLKPRS
jgi:hypothetical protein